MNGNDQKQKLTEELCAWRGSDGYEGWKTGWCKNELKRSVPFSHDDDEIALHRIGECFIVSQGTDGTISFIMFRKTNHPGIVRDLFMMRAGRSREMDQRLPSEKLTEIESI